MFGHYTQWDYTFSRWIDISKCNSIAIALLIKYVIEWGLTAWHCDSGVLLSMLTLIRAAGGKYDFWNFEEV